MNDNTSLECLEPVTAEDNEPSAAELIAELVREERMRTDLPRSCGITIIIHA